MRNTWKKIVCVALSAVMLIAMSITAFAADSPVADGVVTPASGVDRDGNQIRFHLGAYDAVYNDVAAAIQTTDGLKAAMGDAYVDGMHVIEVRKVIVDGADSADLAYPIQLTFNVPGVTANTKVAVLAYVNGQWVSLQCTAGDGTITVTFENAEQLELVAFVVDKSVSAGTVSTGAVSPKTGEHSVVSLMVIAMMLMVGGAACLRKREVR